MGIKDFRFSRLTAKFIFTKSAEKALKYKGFYVFWLKTISFIL